MQGLHDSFTCVSILATSRAVDRTTRSPDQGHNTGLALSLSFHRRHVSVQSVPVPGNNTTAPSLMSNHLEESDGIPSVVVLD
ncbi:hypothetical protein BDN67DRAFT_969255 [Paxillus ammoniavirescens]|nr:hypothetical protein BDN67DRAFT_969255 [Paxillus ammoniavirescens]